MDINSRIFFNGIIKNGSYKIYKKEIESLNNTKYINDIISQIYINSKICSVKYRKYNYGMKFSGLGFIMVICGIIIGMLMY